MNKILDDLSYKSYMVSAVSQALEKALYDFQRNPSEEGLFDINAGVSELLEYTEDLETLYNKLAQAAPVF